MSIKEHIKKVLSVKDSSEALHKFALEKYNEKFANNKVESGTFRYFHHYEVISENEIRIHYKYGGGDIEYDDSFNVKIN